MRVELRIEDLAPGGEGIGRSGGRAVFVPFTAPGDLVAVELPPGDGAVHVEGSALLAAGPVRVEPPCRHFGPEGDRCGGCEWMHASALSQLAAKGRTVREALRKIGRLEPGDYPWLPPLPSPAPLGYRARARFHLDRRGRRLVFFERRSHRPVPVERCHLLAPGLEALRAALGPALVDAGLSPVAVAVAWSELEGRGAAHLRLAAAGAAARARAEALLRSVDRLAGLVVEAEGGAAFTVGDPVLRLERTPGVAGGGVCRTRPDVFQQANREGNALLVAAALDLLAPDGAEVLELFCGAGNFTGPLARRARGVAAVEAQGPALDLARADLEGTPVRFFAGDALTVARALARERARAPRGFDAVLLDPPREGAKGIGAVLRDLGVDRAVYVSCDPATLARDVRGCVDLGFRIGGVQAIDLFPQTHHVEAIVLLVAGVAASTDRRKA